MQITIITFGFFILSSISLLQASTNSRLNKPTKTIVNRISRGISSTQPTEYKTALEKYTQQLLVASHRERMREAKSFSDKCGEIENECKATCFDCMKVLMTGYVVAVEVAILNELSGENKKLH